jgi:hypothetical protein
MTFFDFLNLFASLSPIIKYVSKVNSYLDYDFTLQFFYLIMDVLFVEHLIDISSHYHDFGSYVCSS